MDDETITTAVGKFKRSEDFNAYYSNNVQFDFSAYDLKLIFGEQEQFGENRSFVEQHSSVTVTWLQAKLLQFFLQNYIAIYEANYGKINIPTELLPKEIDPPTEEQQKNVPKAKEIFEILKTRREQFLSSL